jgi:hypothetical protein
VILGLDDGEGEDSGPMIIPTPKPIRSLTPSRFWKWPLSPATAFSSSCCARMSSIGLVRKMPRERGAVDDVMDAG